MAAAGSPAPELAPAYDPARVRETLLNDFRGSVPPVSTPWSYRAGILLVACVMVLLPLVYVGLIGLTCYAVYYHAVNHTSILEVQTRGKGYFLLVLAYVAPMAVGAILILFMLKPLFARPAPGPRRRTLSRADEPLLFEFVDRICAAVRAPRPREIDVDVEVNASAGFRRGWWSMLGDDLVLTIGLPLAAGLTVRQLGGVLAHEFGHFSQGAGMRLTYVIRSIVHWFERVVYERDQWDEWLVSASGSLDLRIGWVLYLARLFVWITRKILYVLMICGHAVAGLMLRQMEFDADRYEARLAGSRTFADTVRRLQVLNVAAQGAQADLRSFYAEGRLGDDLPKLILANVDQLPEELQAKIDLAIADSQTGWFDTHPADRDRIESAAREAAPGVLTNEWPASVLFRDFGLVSRQATWDYFYSIFGERLKAEELHSVDELLRRQQSDLAGGKALDRVFQGAFSLSRAVELPPIPQLTDELRPRAEQTIKQAREAMLASAAAHREPRTRRTNSIRQFVESKQVLALHRAGVRPPRDAFQVPLDPAGAGRAADEHDASVRRLDEQLAAFEAWGARRIAAALALLDNPAFAAQIPEGRSLAAHCRAILPAARAVLAALPARQQLQIDNAVFSALLGQLENHGEDAKFVESLVEQSRTVLLATVALRDRFQGLRYPFDHAVADMTIDRFLLAEPLTDPHAIGGVYEGAEEVVEGLGGLAVRCVGQFALAVEQVETALGLPLVPAPPEPEEPAEPAGDSES